MHQYDHKHEMATNNQPFIGDIYKSGMHYDYIMAPVSQYQLISRKEQYISNSLITTWIKSFGLENLKSTSFESRMLYNEYGINYSPSDTNILDGIEKSSSLETSHIPTLPYKSILYQGRGKIEPIIRFSNDRIHEEKDPLSLFWSLNAATYFTEDPKNFYESQQNMNIDDRYLPTEPYRTIFRFRIMRDDIQAYPQIYGDISDKNCLNNLKIILQPNTKWRITNRNTYKISNVSVQDPVGLEGKLEIYAIYFIDII